MKKIKIAFIIIALGITAFGYSQKDADNSNFYGAKATLKEYKALYILNESGDKKIRSVLRNINNALNDQRLKGKLKVELVVFGDGVELLKKENHYDTLFLQLKNKGVIIAQCENTLKERKISKDELWPFIPFVPTGNGEIIIRQYQGWAIVHP